MYLSTANHLIIEKDICHIPLKIELQKMTALKILVYAITDEHEGAEGRGEYFLHGPKLALI